MGREGGVGAPALLRRGPPFCADAAPAVSMALPSDKAPPSFYSTAARRFAKMGGWGIAGVLNSVPTTSLIEQRRSRCCSC